MDRIRAYKTLGGTTRDPADRRARCLYLKAKARPLVDDIWRLMDLTREEGFAGISAKQVNLLIALLGKVQIISRHSSRYRLPPGRRCVTASLLAALGSQRELAVNGPRCSYDSAN